MVLDLILSELPLFLILVGAGLIIAEAFAPGAVVVIATALATLWAYRELDIYAGTGEGKTSDSSSLRGQLGHVTERVTPTDGEVKLDNGGFNPYYRARSVDGEISEGEEVMVVDPGGGNVVTVESVTNLKDEIDRELEREKEAAE
jgi:membrane-bound ClpP family serine protease